MKRLWLAVAFVTSAATSFGAYSYYYTENFNTIQSPWYGSNWYMNGSLLMDGYSS